MRTHRRARLPGALHVGRAPQSGHADEHFAAQVLQVELLRAGDGDDGGIRVAAGDQHGQNALVADHQLVAGGDVLGLLRRDVEVVGYDELAVDGDQVLVAGVVCPEVDRDWQCEVGAQRRVGIAFAQPAEAIGDGFRRRGQNVGGRICDHDAARLWRRRIGCNPRQELASGRVAEEVVGRIRPPHGLSRPRDQFGHESRCPLVWRAD